MSRSLGAGRLNLAGMNFTGMSEKQLRDLYHERLKAGIHGLCFSPYEEGQGPGDRISPDQIRRRMEIIAPYCSWIRSFSCTDGNQAIPQIAHEFGLKTLAGAWIGEDAEKNQEEIRALTEIAAAGHVDIAAIGNEVLLREEMSGSDLAQIIQKFKSEVPNVPTGYVDAYYLFEFNPDLVQACDLILSNCYPFWEGCQREYATLYMKDMYRRACHAASGKKVLVSETGWPDRGSAFWGAEPSISNVLKYFLDTWKWADEEQIELFWFSSFDEAWKVGAEGDVGAWWGIWDSKGRLKHVQ
jgi:glucan 1,3-beta-glucosidase